MVMTAAEMRRRWRRGEVRPLSPLLDMTAEYAGHWWNLDGNDAWVRATDPNAIAVYEAQKQRSAATLKNSGRRPNASTCESSHQASNAWRQVATSESIALGSLSAWRLGVLGQ